MKHFVAVGSGFAELHDVIHLIAKGAYATHYVISKDCDGVEYIAFLNGSGEKSPDAGDDAASPNELMEPLALPDTFSAAARQWLHNTDTYRGDWCIMNAGAFEGFIIPGKTSWFHNCIFVVQSS